MSDALRARLIAAMIHDADGTEEPDSVAKNATLAVMTIMPILDMMKIPGAVREGIDMKSDILAANDLVSHAIDLLRRNMTDARGDLDEHVHGLEEIAQELVETAEEIGCDECGAYSNDGEGFDGLCGNCADRAEGSDDDVPTFPRETDEWPTVGDRVAMAIDEDVEIVIAAVSQIQINLHEGVWTIVDENGDEHLIEDEGERWETVNPATRSDVVTDPADASLSFDAMFLEDGVSEGEGTPDRNWRGVYSAGGEIVATSDLLYATPQEACLAAVDIHEERTEALA